MKRYHLLPAYSTPPSPPSMWPAQNPGGVPFLPATGGWAYDSYGGSGRDGATGRVTVFFLDDYTAGSAVSAAYPGGYTRILHGNIEGFAAASSPKVLIPIKAGTVQMNSDFRPGNYMDMYMQFAPGNGVLFRQSPPAVSIVYGGATASHQRYWHADFRVGDDAGGIDPSNRDGGSVGGWDVNGTNLPTHNTWINCNFNWSIDECIDGYFGGDYYSFLYCVFGESLHKAQNNKGTIVSHGYGPILGDGYRFDRLDIQRSIFAHLQSRQPLTATIRLSYANNIVYNPGDPDNNTAIGIQLTVDYDATTPYSSPMYANILNNMFVKGPNGASSFNAITVDPAGTDPTVRLPTGSQGYIAGNAVDGWTYATNDSLRTGVWPTGWLQSSEVTAAMPPGWSGNIKAIGTGTTPNSYSSAEKIAFATLIKNSVGPLPGKRTPADRAGVIAGHCLSKLLGSGGQGTCVNSVSGTSDPAGWPNTALRFTPNAGGYPSMGSTAVDPFSPGTAWVSALPLNGSAPDDRILSSGVFSNGLSKAGYTAIEAWGIDQHYYVGGQ